MADERGTSKAFSLPFARIALILAALVALAAVALTVIRSRGDDAPATPATPQAATEGVGDVAAMIGKLEAKLKETPGDARGWHLLGLSYYSVGRYEDAAKAYAKATQLDPSNAESWSALGEAQLLAGPGGVTPAAEASFRKALSIDAKDFRARYFMAVKRDRDGDHEGAIADWIQILKDSPPGAPWEDSVRKVIDGVASEHKIDVGDRVPPRSTPAALPPTALPPVTMGSSGGSVAAAGIPGPSAADLKAASSMTPAQQDEMARGMVARLAARLQENPKDADRWIMLMRSRMMLNDPAGAKDALAKARAAFQGDATHLARFDEAARALGIR